MGNALTYAEVNDRFEREERVNVTTNMVTDNAVWQRNIKRDPPLDHRHYGAWILGKQINDAKTRHQGDYMATRNSGYMATGRRSLRSARQPQRAYEYYVDSPHTTLQHPGRHGFSPYIAAEWKSTQTEERAYDSR